LRLSTYGNSGGKKKRYGNHPQRSKGKKGKSENS
jgi:hypothetical protein